jgi:hypothetical protein
MVDSINSFLSATQQTNFSWAIDTPETYHF